MGIWDAIKYRIKWWDKKAAEKVSNPVIEGEIDLEDAKRQASEFAREVRDLVAAQNGLQREKSSADEKYSNLASAAKKIKEQLAIVDATAEPEKAEKLQNDLNQAAQFAISEKRKADGLANTINRNDAQIKRLKQKINEITAKISDSENKFTELKARNTIAHIEQDIADAESGLSDGNSPLAKLDKFEKAVQEAEDKAAASQEMNDASASGTAKNLLEEYGDSKAATVNDFINNL